MKRLLRLYRDLWPQLYRRALAAISTGRDFNRARLARAGNKISTDSADQQSSLGRLHTGEAALHRVKVFRAALRMFGLKSGERSVRRVYASLVTTRAAARLLATAQKITVRTLLYTSAFRSALSTAGLRLKSSLERHEFIPVAILDVESSSLDSIICSVTAFCSRALVGTASVAKGILRGLSSGLTRMADAQNSLLKARTRQTSNFHGRPTLGHAASASGLGLEITHVFVQLTSYISVSLVVRTATKSHFNGRAIVGDAVSSIAALKQVITTVASVTTDKASHLAGNAVGLIFAAAHALIGTVAVLSASMRSLVHAICRLRVAPVLPSRGFAAWHAFIGWGRATTGHAQRVVSGSRLAQMLSGVVAPADQPLKIAAQAAQNLLSGVAALADRPLKIAAQAAQHLISTLRGLRLALTQSFPGVGVLLSTASMLQGLTTASMSRASGVGIGAVAHINATMRDATTPAETAFSQTASSSRCILSVLSTIDWIYPEPRGSRLYIYQVTGAVQNGETLNLT